MRGAVDGVGCGVLFFYEYSFLDCLLVAAQ
jgi:hypothetical protein